MTDGLKFGTSGLRGLVAELDGQEAWAHACAFARAMSNSGQVAPASAVLIGRDLRASSASIAARCISGLRAAGLVPVDCGELPTPALAGLALAQGVPAIMVTGSHIPEDRNGLKFYGPRCEIDKADEAAIVAARAAMEPGPEALAKDEAPANGEAISAYRQRVLDFFSPDALKGLRVGVYQHSSVARDLLVDVLTSLGAQTTALGRSASFVPVDTEALRPEDVELAAAWSAEHGFDAIVSTDGDADRPLVADERGNFLRGDLIGTVTAALLETDCVVTPVNSNSGIERCGRFRQVVRTRIGSPYVIAGMSDATGSVVGFEANGGVLVGSEMRNGARVLPALPTRDALVPIVATLRQAASGTPLSRLAAIYGFASAASGRLKDIPAARSGPLLQRLAQSADVRADLFGGLIDVREVDLTDGVRMSDATGRIIHYRASGNAPEFRCYVEAANDRDAAGLLAEGLSRAASVLSQ